MPKLVIERGRKWEISELKSKTIALDGAVVGPYIDAESKIFSFDHHGSCLRGVTLATCEQVRDFLLLGLDVTGYNILLNDIDLDSALSAWLLEYPTRVSDPLVSKLIHMVGRQDAHSGGYPAEKELQVIVDWIAEPEIRMRSTTSYQTCPNDFLQFVLEAIWRRIEQYAEGKVPPDLTERSAVTEEYEVIKKGTGWKMVKSSSDRPLRALASDNVNRFVIVRELEHESIKSLHVTIGKRSEVVTGFPIGPADKVGTILYELNETEPDRPDKTDNWGGSSTIGGSPRNENGVGTVLSVDQIFETIEKVVNNCDPEKGLKQAKLKGSSRSTRVLVQEP